MTLDHEELEPGDGQRGSWRMVSCYELHMPGSLSHTKFQGVRELLNCSLLGADCTETFGWREDVNVRAISTRRHLQIDSSRRADMLASAL